jgi:uncharacterized protein (TIGR03118 family)
MKRVLVLRKNWAASDRQHRYRPALEELETRCLLSGGFAQVNLASDVPGLARVLDRNLVNPWGIAFSPTGPFWFAENGRGVSNLLDGRGQPVPLVVTVPPAGGAGSGPTGTVFNGGAGFALSENGISAPSRFLFATADGSILGWSALVDPARALPAVDNSSSGAVYTGLALAADPAGRSFLYAADFSRGTIDVFDQQFRPLVRPGSFQDPSLPAGFVPFNVQNINNMLFVTYAQQDGDRRDDVAGAGHGFIDVYDTGGRLLRRFASQGALNSPWALAPAPADFGPFGGALLVGNNGDGRINAYDPGSGAFLGQLDSDNGMPIVIPNLWALTFGNGHAGGDAHTLFFAAGVDYDEHGLFGAIQAPGRRGADTAGPGAFNPTGPGEPGDYPIPPSGGPGFRAGSDDPPIPIADLLPLNESSLALVPTLSSTSQPATRTEAAVPAAQGASASNGSVGNSQAAPGAHDGAVALNTFLDLNASQNVPQQKTALREPGSSLHAVGADRSPAADSNAGAEAPLSEPYVVQLETASSEEQGAEALASSGRADVVLAGVPLASGPQAAGERIVGSEALRTENRGGWTKLMNLLLVVSIPGIWAYWLTHAMRSRQSCREQARSNVAKLRPKPSSQGRRPLKARGTAAGFRTRRPRRRVGRLTVTASDASTSSNRES